jgi:LmbE family N-acetylglucosaminyl deacetylase
VLELKLHDGGCLRLLCVGAHCDDIEIGCGGTILKLVAARPRIEVHWVVFSSNDQRKKEALKSAAAFLEKVPTHTVIVHNFRDGFLPYLGGAVKERFEQLKSDFSPDLIFTHYQRDLHQDHRLISDLTWNTFRSHLILEYEIPKYDGDFGAPNLFVNLDESLCAQKIEFIMDAFPSQSRKDWFSRELFNAVLRLRGMEASSRSGYAEGFYCRKVSLGLEV